MKRAPVPGCPAGSTTPARIGGIRSLALAAAGLPIAARRDRGLDHRAHVRLTLRLIGLEQARIRAAAQHRTKLPRKVRGIAKAVAHALPEERRRLMRGIAGK